MYLGSSLGSNIENQGLDKRQHGNVLMIAPAAEIAERERQQIVNNKQTQRLAPLQTEYLGSRYADASAIHKLFAKNDTSEDDKVSTANLLSTRGSMMVDQRTNALLVTETTEKLEQIRRIVALLDAPVRQVLVEARIAMANANFDEELGIEWGVAGINRVNSDDNLFFGGNTGSIIVDSRNSFREAALELDQGNDQKKASAVA